MTLEYQADNFSNLCCAFILALLMFDVCQHFWNQAALKQPNLTVSQGNDCLKKVVTIGLSNWKEVHLF